MLKKADLPAPSLPEETASVPELGGDVLVRGLLLKDRLETAIVDGFGRMSCMLAPCVLVEGADGQPVPLFTADEWERWGSRHYAAALNLWNIVRRLSGFDEEAVEKNSTAQKSGLPAISP